MPELPEVEVLVRHLGPLLAGRRIQAVEVRRARVLRGGSEEELRARLMGAWFGGVERRGKYLVFRLQAGEESPGKVREVRSARTEPNLTAWSFLLLGHLGMTGRLYLQAMRAPIPRHAVALFSLGRDRLVFEDPRGFGRLTLDPTVLDGLGPEPLADGLRAADLAARLRGSRQPIKVRLLDQAVVAGVGNIYASEALFRARLSPRLAAGRLRPGQVRRLWAALRQVLREAIRWGSTVPLNWAGVGASDGLFYYGGAPGTATGYEERLKVYARAGQPCARCGARIRRLAQGGRSTFFCPRCQRG